MLDWTEIVIAVIAYGAGVLQTWLRLKDDARRGRSLRPPAEGPNDAER